MYAGPQPSAAHAENSPIRPPSRDPRLSDTRHRGPSQFQQLCERPPPCPSPRRRSAPTDTESLAGRSWTSSRMAALVSRLGYPISWPCRSVNSRSEAARGGGRRLRRSRDRARGGSRGRQRGGLTDCSGQREGRRESRRLCSGLRPLW